MVVNVVVLIMILICLAPLEGEDVLQMAIVVDAPWSELGDFSAVMSMVESDFEGIAVRIQRFNLINDTDWQVVMVIILQIRS